MVVFLVALNATIDLIYSFTFNTYTQKSFTFRQTILLFLIYFSQTMRNICAKNMCHRHEFGLTDKLICDIHTCMHAWIDLDIFSLTQTQMHLSCVSTVIEHAPVRLETVTVSISFTFFFFWCAHWPFVTCVS